MHHVCTQKELLRNHGDFSFGGTLQQPNSLIFTKVGTATVNLGPQLDISTDFQYFVKQSIGCVGAPLMYATPHCHLQDVVPYL